MNIGWMKKTLQVEILSKDNGYVFSYTKDWLYKHRNRFEYVFHEVDDGKDVYYSNYDIADDGTITIETSGGSGGDSGSGGSEPLMVTIGLFSVNAMLPMPISTSLRWIHSLQHQVKHSRQIMA